MRRMIEGMCRSAGALVPLGVFGLVVLLAGAGRAEEVLPKGVERWRPGPSLPEHQVVLGSWEGRLGVSGLYAPPTPIVVDDRPTLVALWRNWKFAEALPEVDFKRELVVATMWLGSRVDAEQPRWSLDGRSLGFPMEGTLDISGRPHYFVKKVPRGALEWIGTGPDRVPVEPTITGEITGEEGVIVPEGDTVTVQLLEFSERGGKRVLAEQTQAAPPNFPISYKLRFDRSRVKLDGAHDYSLYAIIGNNRRLLFGTGLLVRDGHDLIVPKKDRIPVLQGKRVLSRVPIRVKTIAPE